MEVSHRLVYEIYRECIWRLENRLVVQSIAKALKVQMEGNLHVAYNVTFSVLTFPVVQFQDAEIERICSKKNPTEFYFQDQSNEMKTICSRYFYYSKEKLSRGICSPNKCINRRYCDFFEL